MPRRRLYENRVASSGASMDSLKTTSLGGSFRSLFVALKAVGLWPVHSSNTLVHAMHLAYSVVLLLAGCYVFAVRFGAFTVSKEHTAVLVTMQLWWCQALLVVGCLGVAARRPGRLQSLHRLIDEFRTENREDSSRRLFARSLIMTLWTLILLVNVLFAAFLLAPSLLGEHLATTSMHPISIYPFSSNDSSGAAFQRSISLATTIVGFEAWLLALVHFVILCATLTKELQITNQYLVDALQPDGAIEVVRKRHHRLCGLVDLADRALCVHVSAAFVSFVPTLCVVVEDAVFGEMGLYMRLSMLLWLTLAAFQVIVVSTCSARLTRQAHGAVSYLHAIDTNHLDAHQLQQISIFLLRLNGPPIGLSVCGMTTITTESVLAFTGTVAVYVAFVVHLH